MAKPQPTRRVPELGAVLSLAFASCVFQTQPQAPSQGSEFSLSFQDPQSLFVFDSLIVILEDSSETQDATHRDTLFNGRAQSASDLQKLRPRSYGNALRDTEGFRRHALNDPGVTWLTLEGYRDSARTYFQRLIIEAGNKPVVISHTQLRLDRFEYVGLPRFSSGLADGPQLVVDASGRPYIAYADASQGYRALVMRLNAAQGGWDSVGHGPISEGSAGQLDMVALKSGEIVAAFNDYTDVPKLKVLCLPPNGETWEALSPTSLPIAWTSQLDLAVGPDGQPYLAYKEEDSEWKASVSRFDPNLQEWVQVGQAAFSDGPVNFLSLDVSPRGVAYVAFYDENLNGRATVMRCTPETHTWEKVGPAGFTEIKTGETTIRIAADETPYLAFIDGAIEDKPARVMRFREGVWQTFISDRASPGAAHQIDLSIDSQNQALLAFSDAQNAAGITVMRANEIKGQWDVLGAAGTSAGKAVSISLALDGQSHPWVAFAEGRANKLSVMRWLQE
jgi:hypothetical protein